AGGPDELADAWLRVVLTDPARPASPMERLRERWPHTLVLDFDPDGAFASVAADIGRVAKTADPVEICELFVEFASACAAGGGQLAVLRDVIEAVQNGAAEEGAHGDARSSRARETAADLDDAGSVDEWLANAGRGQWLDDDLAFPERGGNPAAA